MLLSSLLVAGVLALPSLAQMRRQHSGIARRMELEKKAENNLAKRSFSGRMTYYATGLGACGQYNAPGDFIVALNSAQYGGGYPGPNCFKSITISFGGKQVQATIVDECPTCGFGELDLSEGLFTQFAGTDAGIFNGEWWFNDGSGGSHDPPSQHTEAPPPQHTETPPPQHTETPPPQHTETPPQNPETPPQNTEAPPQTTEAPPQTTEAPPQTTEAPPQTTEAPPQNTEAPPQTTDTPPKSTDTPPQYTDTAPETADVAPPQNTETQRLQNTEVTPTTTAIESENTSGHCKRRDRRVPVNF